MAPEERHGGDEGDERQDYGGDIRGALESSDASTLKRDVGRLLDLYERYEQTIFIILYINK
jgi:hypothetical protein